MREQSHHAAEFPIAGSERRMAGPATLAAAHTAAGSLRSAGEALRGRIHESGPAPGHGTAGGENPDLVADDTVPGDRHRVNQRIEPHLRLPGVMITVSQDPDGRRLSCPASLPGRARPPGVPGETS